MVYLAQVLMNLFSFSQHALSSFLFHHSYTPHPPFLPSSLACPSAAIATGVMKGCGWTSVGKEWNNLSDSPAERTHVSTSLSFFLSSSLVPSLLWCLLFFAWLTRAQTSEQKDQAPMPVSTPSRLRPLPPSHHKRRTTRSYRILLKHQPHRFASL